MVTGKLKRTAALVIIMLSYIGTSPAQAALQAYVDRNPVAEDESFTLTLESSDDIDGSPDLSPLRKDFDIEGQGKSSNLTIINGSMSRKTQWRISLMAKRSGQLKIPAISIGSEHTQPLTVSVTPASQAQAAPGSGDLFMEVNVKPRTVYVQQQVIYTVRLYHAVDLASGSSLSEPSLSGSDAVVEKLGKDKEFETVRNGMRYDVIERSYAIYPQKSGGIDIPPLVFNGEIVQAGGGGFFAIDPFNQSTRHKRLRSRTEHIDVKPVPAAFHGSQWLPARSVQLDDNWTPDPPVFKVGQAVTRTVAIMADGLTASQLPALTSGSAINGVKQYPDQPALKDTKDMSGVTGLRTEKIAYIPTHAGNITLPAIKVSWWNTATDKLEEENLPARTFTVLPSPAANGVSPPPAPAVTAPAPNKQTKSPAPLASSTPQAPQHAKSGADHWPWLALLLGVGWLGTLVIWWWRSHRRPARNESTKSDDGEESLRSMEKTLQNCCMSNDAAGAKSAVLAWARRQWPQDPPISLTAVARRCPQALSEALLELDRVLYAQMAASWRGNDLWQLFSKYRAMNKAKDKKQDLGLEPLYRSQ